MWIVGKVNLQQGNLRNISVRWSRSTSTDINHGDRHLLGGVKMADHLWCASPELITLCNHEKMPNTFQWGDTLPTLQLLKKLNQITIKLRILLLVYNPKELKTSIKTKSCMWILHNYWQWPGGNILNINLLMNGWTNVLIHTEQYHSATTRIDVLIHISTWMKTFWN